jgi:Ca2+-transporting ATPase
VTTRVLPDSPAPTAAEAYAEPRGRVLATVGGRDDGLSTAEASARLLRWGRNEIPQPAGPGVWTVFVRQFASPLIYVLVVAAGLSAWLGEWADAAFIALVLLLNAGIGTAQEHRAQRSAAALRQMVTTGTDVIRDGDVVEVDATALVVGDVLLLASGNRVPADVRLLDSHGLRVDESPLTGESLPVHKDAAGTVAPAAALADRPTMGYAGTLVVHGRGRGVVTATGPATELGTLAGQLQEPTQTEPPLLTRMRRFTAVIGAAVGVGAALMGVVELLRGTAWHEVLLVAVALAVSAIPEGLPVALTVALAVAVNRMARRNVIVRRLVAIETLGSCTLIGSDKTGTLTVNELTATRIAVPGQKPWPVTGVGTDPTGVVVFAEGDGDGRGGGAGAGRAAAERLARAGVLCNEATLARDDAGWVHRGDAVDVALLVLGHKLGITGPQALRSRPQIAAIPFEPEHRFAATLHAVDSVTAEIVVKGAVERVLPMCAVAAAVDGHQPLDADQITATAHELAAEGHRVIAIAAGLAARPAGDELEHHHLRRLTLLGLVAMTDPLRPDARAAVAGCQAAGIAVAMITGDHPATALSIARELGLADRPDQVVTGAQLHDAAAGGPAAVDALTATANVFARVEPAQKLAIVESLTRQGHIVAVTGDGANDAPALHHAHVGVAMGRSGTDVAREAAEVVITDDTFSSIAAGVHDGRVAYANVRKVIQLLITTGAGELVLVLSALAFGLPLPLLAVQLLWLNLVTNGIQDVALAFEPAEGDEMHRPPRNPTEPIFNRLMIERVLLSAAVIGGVSLAAYHWLLAHGWSVDAARNSIVLLMVLFENVQVFNTRSELRSALTHDPRRNRPLVAGTLLAQAVHIAAMHIPATQRVLGLQPITLGQWASLLALALLLLVAVEVHKAVWRLRVRPRRSVGTRRR